MKHSRPIRVGTGMVAVVSVAVAGLIGFSPQSATVDASNAFIKTSEGPYGQSFDTADSLDDMVFEIADGRPFHHRDSMPLRGDHASLGPNGECGNPFTTRPLATGSATRISPTGGFHIYDNEVKARGLAYRCAVGGDHMMTAYDSKGYYHFDFRPKVAFDDANLVCWDQSITNMGGKWTEIALVPLDTFNANGQRMDYTNPVRRDGPASWGLPITDGVVKGVYERGTLFGSINEGIDSSNASSVKTESKTLRTQHCFVDNQNGTITMSRGMANGSVQRHTFAGSFPDKTFLVIFSEVGYNPQKRSDWNDPEFTWHWDNIVISSDASAQPPPSGTPTAPEPPTTQPPSTGASTAPEPPTTQPPSTGASTAPEPPTTQPPSSGQTIAPEPKRYASATRLG